MKLEKDVLKMIVKECLIEILAEGIAPSSSKRPKQRLKNTRKKKALSESFENSRQRSRSLKDLGEHSSNYKKHKQKKLSYLDNISFGDDSTQGVKKPEAINNLTNSITKDPVMQDILADTAMTTLQEQVESRMGKTPSNVPLDKAASVVDKADPTELFGESSKNWATLAFS